MISLEEIIREAGAIQNEQCGSLVRDLAEHVQRIACANPRPVQPPSTDEYVAPGCELFSDPTKKKPLVTDEMVNRFLTWPLPASVRADEVATIPNRPHRTGTTLLTAIEARQMLDYVMSGPRVEKQQ